MSDNRSGAFLGGLLIGAVLGTISGILIAPRTGRETRQLLKKSADALPELAEDLSSSVQLQADRLSESALRNWDETLVRLKEAIAAGLEASQRERQQVRRTETAASPGGVSKRESLEELAEVYSHSYTSKKTANLNSTPTETVGEPED